jgi:hypothetical protein
MNPTVTATFKRYHMVHSINQVVSATDVGDCPTQAVITIFAMLWPTLGIKSWNQQ